MTERRVRMMVNHHADPSLRHYALVIGPRAIGTSDGWVERMARRADLVVVAWGEQGHQWRGQRMLALLRDHKIEPHALALTPSGAPAHPLHLSAALTPRPLAVLETC